MCALYRHVRRHVNDTWPYKVFFHIIFVSMISHCQVQVSSGNYRLSHTVEFIGLAGRDDNIWCHIDDINIIRQVRWLRRLSVRMRYSTGNG